MSMTRHARLTLYAERIQALINSRATSPSLEELQAVIAETPHNSIFNSPPVEAKPVKVQCRSEKRFGAASALFDGAGNCVSTPPLSLIDLAIARMAAGGFVYHGDRADTNQDALVLGFHRGDKRMDIVFSGLEQLQNSTPERMLALIEARCSGAIKHVDAVLNP